MAFSMCPTFCSIGRLGGNLSHGSGQGPDSARWARPSEGHWHTLPLGQCSTLTAGAGESVGRAELGGLDVQYQTSCGYLGITKYSEYIALPFSCKRRGFCPSCAGRRMAQTVAPLVECVIPWVPTRQWVVSVPVPLLNAHTLCSRLSLQLVLAIPSLNQLLAQAPPVLPRVPEGCISLIAGLLLAARSATVLMVPSSPPAWTRAAHSGWLGATARHPTPVGPVALAILRPPQPRGCIPDGTVAK
jgi:Transposase zinc-binding domain